MALDGHIQPEIIRIREDLRLRKFDGKFETFLPGYQDPVVYQNSEGIFEESRIPNLKYVEGMCAFLSRVGELYYIEALENGSFVPVGDVTIKPENPPIAIWQGKYRGIGIGKAVMEAVLQRLAGLGYEKVTGSTVYRWNLASQKLHEGLGFQRTGEDEKEITYELDLTMRRLPLETDRLILRTPRAEDVSDYMEFRNSEFVLRYNAMSLQSEADAVKALSKEDKEGSEFAIERKEDGKMIGMIFVGEDSLRYGVASRELSYYLSEPYSRQGYMKEALGAVISWLFETQSLECIAARSFAPNQASRTLLKSLGFHEDGLIPKCVKGYQDVVFDDVLYSLFRQP